MAACKENHIEPFVLIAESSREKSPQGNNKKKNKRKSVNNEDASSSGKTPFIHIEIPVYILEADEFW